MNRSTTTTTAAGAVAVTAAAWLAWRGHTAGRDLAEERSQRLLERMGMEEGRLLAEAAMRQAQNRAWQQEQEREAWKAAVLNSLVVMKAAECAVEAAEQIVDAALSAYMTEER